MPPWPMVPMSLWVEVCAEFEVRFNKKSAGLLKEQVLFLIQPKIQGGWGEGDAPMNPTALWVEVVLSLKQLPDARLAVSETGETSRHLIFGPL